MAEKKRINQQWDRKFPLLGVFGMFLIIAVLVAAYGAYHYWCWESGTVYDYRKNDYFLNSMISYVLDSWKNSGLIALGIVLPIILFVVTSSFGKSIYGVTKGNPLAVLFGIMVVFSVAAQIVLLILCKQKVQISQDIAAQYAFWYPIMFVVMLFFIVQLAYVLEKKCMHCGYIHTLDLEETSHYSYEVKHTTGGKYETRTAEIKDDCNQKIGEIETKEYVPVSHYTTTHTRNLSKYVCKRCGERMTRG
ncbi:MAG: hypothetical protein DBX59_03310 [Bacillota bacterium]|nr:MAG: hypothetical protein DBX59_03310 [Bacillota bacterium]